MGMQRACVVNSAVIGLRNSGSFASGSFASGSFESCSFASWSALMFGQPLCSASPYVAMPPGKRMRGRMSEPVGSGHPTRVLPPSLSFAKSHTVPDWGL
eukprot:2259109-Prymnesium_polylepis.1